jgi:voltage-gated potassium channel Kch
MIGILVTVFISAHIVACMWYFTAKLDNFGPDTWVVRGNYENEDDVVKYMAALYWAFTTLTTVGYGDIIAETLSEKFLAVIWMIIGLFFLSFAVSNSISLLS